MGKRKRRQRSELPLFDLPLNPGQSEPESAADLELSKGSEPSGDFELSSSREPTSDPEGQHTEGQQTEGPTLLPGVENPAPLAPGEDRVASVGRPAGDLSSLFARRDAPAGPQGELLESAVQDRGAHASESDQATKRVDREGGGVRDSDAEANVAPLSDRLLGGLADLAIQVLVLGLAIAASHGMGVTVTLADWQPFMMLMLAFSFLYWTVPLAFWGQTPGMAWVGHTARAEGGQPLTFGQTFLRWLGAILTFAFVGLPILAAWTGRSLTDLISKSRTLSRDADQPRSE